MIAKGSSLLSILVLLVFMGGCGSGGSGGTTVSDQSGAQSAAFADQLSVDKPASITIDAYKPNPAVNRVSVPADSDRVAASQNKVALDLYSYYAQSGSTNMAFAPYGFFQALGMTAAGAKTATASEMQNAFFAGMSSNDWLQSWSGINNGSANQPLSSKNIFWGQSHYLFSADFLDTFFGFFPANSSAVDYVTLGYQYKTALGSWASQVTNRRIGYIPVDTDTPEKTRLVLGSSSCMEDTLGPQDAVMQSFTGLFEKNDGTQFWVPMLKGQGVYTVYNSDKLSAYELPIGSTGLALLVLMPVAGQYDNVESRLTDVLPDVLKGLGPAQAQVVLPKFKIDTSQYLDGFMKLKGISSAFDKKAADFSGINSLGYAYLKTVAEATSVGVGDGSIYAGSVDVAVIEATPDEPKDVWSGGYYLQWGSVSAIDNDTFICHSVYVKAGTADARPFIFVIRDTKTNLILYMGRLLDAGGTEAGTRQCQFDTLYFDPVSFILFTPSP